MAGRWGAGFGTRPHSPYYIGPMPSSRGPLRPLGGIVLLVLQLLTAGAWAVLEGQVAAAAAVPHIERAGGTDCPPPHDETWCRLCQVETGRVPLCGPALLPRSQPVRSPVPPQPAVRRSSLPILSTGAPRAPPAPSA